MCVCGVFKHIAQFLDFMLEVVLTEILLNTCGIYPFKKIILGHNSVGKVLAGPGFQYPAPT